VDLIYTFDISVLLIVGCRGAEYDRASRPCWMDFWMVV
jgi:hypothetical protein